MSIRRNAPGGLPAIEPGSPGGESPGARQRDDVFAKAGVAWHRRWAVAPGEHVHAGRYVWEVELRTAAGPRALTAWCETRKFETNAKGECVVVARYRVAIERRPEAGEWPSLMLAMQAASAAAVKRKAA